MSNEEQPLLGRDLGRDCVDSGKDAGGRPPFRSAAGGEWCIVRDSAI